MAAKVLLVGSLVALAAASLRPSSPDQLHDLLVWAQRVQAQSRSAARLHDKGSLDKPWRSQHSERPAASTPQPQTTSQPQPQESQPQQQESQQQQQQPQQQPQPQAWSPPPVADSVLELLRPGLPAYEEYDRNQRFSHSFLHGYRHT